MNDKKLYRSTRNSKILGVCGGIAAYFGIDATVVRVITVMLALITSGVPLVIAYVILGVVIPKDTEADGDRFNADGSFNTDRNNFNADGSFNTDRNNFNADGSNFNRTSDSGKRSDRNFNPFE